MIVVTCITIPMEKDAFQADIDDIYRNILLSHNIDILRHIVVFLLCIDREDYYYIVGVVLM